MRKALVAGLAIAVIAVVIVLVSRRGDHDSPATKVTANGSEGSAHGARTPSLPSSTGSGAPSPVFVERKAAAVAELRRSVEQRLMTCPAPVEATPQDTLVTFHLVFDPRLSEPELQRFVVQGTELGRTTSPLSAQTKQCIEKLQGVTLNVLAKRTDMPSNSEQIDETFALPLR